ncbi:hypothetical protein ACHAXT_005818 [Thalassiosira profunda]
MDGQGRVRRPTFAIKLALAFGIFGAWAISQRNDLPSMGGVVEWRNATAVATNCGRQRKLADGCFHVFLDVGANIGIHGRFLLEPFKYPKARIARMFFRKHFGPEESRDNRDFCVFSFEPNPSHRERHEEMRRAYEAVGWRYHPIFGGYGFTTLKSSCRKRCDPEHVPVYRLSSWIDREVHGREIPQPFAINGYHNGPRVTMKMDIEMMEWLVFPDLLLSGVLCRDIAGVIGEFHLKANWFFYPITFDDRSRKGKNFTIERWEDADELQSEWLAMIEQNPHCHTQMSMRDDETYRTDGMPWPTDDSLEANSTA